MSALAATAKEPSDLFFASDTRHIEQSLDPFLTRDPAGIVASYVAGKEDCFGGQKWQEHFGINVGEPKLPSAFYTWWYSPDVVEPDKLNCETHLPPVFQPNFITLMQLEQLAEKPKNGLPAAYISYGAIKPHGLDPAGIDGWLVMRRGVFEYGKVELYKPRRGNDNERFLRELNAKTGSNYDELPTIIDLATVLFARHVYTGEYHLGGAEGMERRHTLSVCKELITEEREYYKSFKTYFEIFNVAVGRFCDSRLCVWRFTNLEQDRTGIAAIRRFASEPVAKLPVPAKTRF